MLQKTRLAMFCALLVCVVSLQGQEPLKPKDESEPNRFWQATLSGGNYRVALDRIVSVSRHKYPLDGALIVDEVTVDTVGQALARFCFITKITGAAADNAVSSLESHGRELIDRAAQRTGSVMLGNLERTSSLAPSDVVTGGFSSQYTNHRERFVQVYEFI